MFSFFFIPLLFFVFFSGGCVTVACAQHSVSDDVTRTGIAPKDGRLSTVDILCFSAQQRMNQRFVHPLFTEHISSGHLSFPLYSHLPACFQIYRSAFSKTRICFENRQRIIWESNSFLGINKVFKQVL